MLLSHSMTPPDPPPCRQRRYHPPCAGFDNAAVGLLQLGVRGPAAVDTRAVTYSAERRCSACVWFTSLWPCLVISDATTLAACQPHECSLNSAHWCMPFTTTDLHRISQTLRHCTDCCDSSYSLRSPIICHYGLCHAAYTVQVRRAGLRVCKFRCLEPPSRAHSSPIHTCNL